MKKWLLTSLFILAIAVLAACGGSNESSESSDSNDASNSKEEKAEGLLSDGKLVIGVTAGPHEQIAEKVKELAAEKGLTVELKVFSDYIMPNMALHEKELDLNIYQHLPFMEQFNKDRGTNIVKVADSVNFPMGLYSTTVKDVNDLPKGAKVGIPSDPTNAARALMLWQESGVIKLKEGVFADATKKDIVENEKELEFIELEAAQIPNQLEELDAAAINTNYAIERGFVPTEDSIFLEPKESPWVNTIAARAEDKDDEAIKQFVEIYHSDEVAKFIDETFKGSVVISW